MPQWLEDLTTQYTLIHGGTVSKTLLGYTEIKIKNEFHKISFEAEVALNNPGIDHITLQHDWIRYLLNDIEEFDILRGIPAIKFETGDDTPGYWSLWQISAKNKFDNKVSYQCFFISDNGKHFKAYANEIWSRLVSGNISFKIEHNLVEFESQMIEKELNDTLFVVFQNLEAEVLVKMKTKKENKENSYVFQKTRIEKIGIVNIRQSKILRLEKEHENWLREFQSNQKVIPGIKQLLTIRING